MNKLSNGILLLGIVVASTCAADSAAVYFAKQAGVIAGAAQACGQPITVMTMRAGEVIDTLKTDATDKTYALAAFAQAQQQAGQNEVQSQLLSCPQVISDYNALPLMQPDYQEKVIKPLLSTSPTAAAQTQTATPASTPAAVPATPQVPALPQGAHPPQTNPLAMQNIVPGNTAPAQNYVMGNNAANSTMPINPAYGGQQAAQQPSTSNQSLEMQRLQLAQQFAQMAQTLAMGGQQQAAVGVGQPNANNPVYNSQLNEQLNGVGANNPIFTGNPLPQVIPPK